ncbi:MAG TPA: hypothetical protein PKW33_05740 [Anaerolineaceae bacterium]|nr:hypothetical protein [Anaerolineaceae bacterium]HPN51069.1 hypothetical protein [Anaerolineaceae bacterium]
MSEELTPKKKISPRRNALAAGLILILVGAALLIAPYLNFGYYFMAVLGVIMLALGVFTREEGWIIPGGVVGGIGLGIITTASPLSAAFGQIESGGIFLLSFAAGWFIIPLFSVLFTKSRNYWAFIPGSIMAVIGALILLKDVGGLTALELIGKVWPVILIIIGVSILIKAFRKSDNAA